ncbi:MAG: transglutaminase family protein, partial [Synechococcaceae cyanobacterium ELA182]
MDTLADGAGVCRDYAHLAITLCRCLNIPRCGRVLIARGRDAADVPFLRSFGEHHLLRLEVITESITEQTQEQNA